MVEEITSTSVCEITDGDSEGDLTTNDYLEALLEETKFQGHVRRKRSSAICREVGALCNYLQQSRDRARRRRTSCLLRLSLPRLFN